MTTPVTSLRDIDTEKQSANEQMGAVHQTLRDLINQSFSYWQNDGVLERHGSGGFGVVLRIVRKGDGVGDLNDANGLFDFTYEHGNQSRRFLNRALCKLRAALRTGKNTGDLAEDEFENVVTDEEMDGNDPQLGEYPHRGGVVVTDAENGKYIIYVAVSGFSGRQDANLGVLLGLMAVDKLTAMDDAAAAESPATTDHVVTGG